MTDKKLLKEIKEEVKTIEIFDNHEHIMYESERRKRDYDFFSLFFMKYCPSDLGASGLKPEDIAMLQNTNIDLEKKWLIFEPHYKYLKNTTITKVVEIALNDIYGIEKIDLEGIKKATEKIKEFNGQEYYKDVLKDKCKFSYILNDVEYIEEYQVQNPEKDYFLDVIRLDRFFDLNSKQKVAKIEDKHKVQFDDFKKYLGFIDEYFEKRKNSAYTIKIGTAYGRDIYFEDTSYAEAEKNFIKILNVKTYDQYQDQLSYKEIRPFQDFMHHYIIKKATEYGLVVQFHTGLIGGNANDYRDASPAHLINLFLKYRSTRFDLLHAGYPFTDEMITLAKTFPNVYVNLCWIPQISMKLYTDILDTLIETVPSNKILGFGGDYVLIEGAYSAQKIARQSISEVLYGKVNNGYLGFDDAVELAEIILNGSAKKLYLK